MPLPDSSSPASEEEIFHAAAGLPAEERPAYLLTACEGNPAVRARVEQLLTAHDDRDFMDRTSDRTVRMKPELVPSSLQQEVSGERIGHYKLLEQIGEGGFGTVWVAEQEQPVRRRVALKIIKLGMDTRDVIARFEQERQALAMMDHPNIAKVFDAGATPTGRPYFVMELVRGIRITDYCDQANLPTPQRLRLFIAVCHAVQHAHQKGIIHRDLKPSNILVTPGDDGEPAPKVIDFGVAKAARQSLTDLTVYTQFEQMIGTPAYMSPEQAGSGPMDIDTRSDVYSLGVLLYELLTGRPPFDPRDLLSAGLEEMRRLIREVEPPKPSTCLSSMKGALLSTLAQHRHTVAPKLLSTIRGDLDWIVMKALEKNRTRRYDTANDFAADVGRYLGQEPIVAHPPSFGYRAGKFIRKHKGAVASVSVIAVILVAATIISGWQAVRATRAQEEAEGISTFLTEVFQSPDPGRDGRTITVAETLARAARKLETDLSRQPDRRARLQRVLGATYIALGLPREAIPLEEKARDHLLDALGSEHPDTLAAMQDLAHGLSEAGRQAEALALCEQVLASRRKVLGAKHPATLQAMSTTALVYHAVGRRPEALKLGEQALTLRRQVLGAESSEALVSMNNLATFYFDANRQDEALQFRELVVEISRRKLGGKHPDTLRAVQSLARSYFEAGRREEALKMREELVERCREVFGPEHSDTLGTMADLVASYSSFGRRDEALALNERILEGCRRGLGPKHPNTVKTMENLASSYYEIGRRDEALRMREQVLELRREILPPGHPDTLRAMNVLAISYFKTADRKDQALVLREQALDLRRGSFPPGHPDTLMAMQDLAGSYFEAGRRKEALELREQVLDLRRKVLRPGHPHSLRAMQDLAVSLIDAGRGDEARALQEEATNALPPLAQIQTDQLRILEQRALRRALDGQWKEAAADLTKSVELDPSSVRLLQLGSVLLQSGDPSAARALGQRALTSFANPRGMEDAERAARLCLLLPVEGPDLAAADHLADTALTLGAGKSSLLPWAELTKGWAEFRTGQFAAAADRLGKCATSGIAGEGKAAAWAVLAMTHHRLQQPDDARAALEQSASLLGPLFDKPDATARAFPDESWQNWLVARIAFREARRLIDGTTQ